MFLCSQTLTAGATPYISNAFSPSGGPYDNGYPQTRYQNVLDIIISIYSPIVAARGGTFHILSDWTDGAVNMWAFKLGSEFWLEIPGGMSRYHLITEEGFVLSACHELGHLLGGAPFKGAVDISLEGQSDYYASRFCIGKVLSILDPYKQKIENEEVSKICADAEDVQICERVLDGALSLSSYYAELEKVTTPRFDSPSEKIVAETLKVHPPAQCRLDTFFAGYFKKARPTCWYKN